MKTKEKINELLSIKEKEFEYGELEELFNNAIERLINNKSTRSV